ncbi:MAG TPA: sulfotransferase [Rhodanobacteraceae bacterium]
MARPTPSHSPSTPASAAPSSPGVPFDRTAGLSHAALKLLREVHAALQRRDWAAVQNRLSALIALAPAHPEVLRVRAAIAHLQGRGEESVALLRRVLETRPYDAQALTDLGSALANLGDADGAENAFRRSAEIEPQRVAPLLGLAQFFERTGKVEQSIAILREALDREPANVTARNMLARELHFAGRVGDAESEYRRVLASAPASATAWYGLSTLRTQRFDAADLASLEALAGRADLREPDRVPALFALAKAYEDNARYEDAFRTLTAANAARRNQLRWDAAKFSANARDIEAAFSAPVGRAADASLGDDLVFIVGMPRSGSTLVEQMLAAHPDVATGGELDDMRDIIRDESQRRERDYPAWIVDATPDDWQRLGRSYLERIAQRRGSHARFLDKGLLNWRYLGAIAAMLPGARFIDCRRDPLETCLSCYRQLFANELAFTYEIAELASFWRDYDRLMRHWQRQFPDRLAEIAHEDLIANPEAEIRRLLDFCGLAFDDACLRFHESDRAVRTASAAQVREPLRPDTARAARYGASLDPLRELLEAEARHS